MKKLISILLVAAMLLAVLPMAVFAEGNSGEIVLPTDCFHSRFIYTNNGENHTVTCKDCNTVLRTEAHTFVDGTCVCGAEEAIEPAGPTYIDDSALTFTMSVIASEEIRTNFSIMSFAGENAKFDSFYLEVTRNDFNNGPETVVFGEAEGMSPMTVTAAGKMRSASYTGVYGYMMGDEFTCTLYAYNSADPNTIYVSTPVTQSIKDKLDTMVASADADTSALGIAMLNYGAAAQIYFDYNTSDLVNKDLTAGQQIVPEVTAVDSQNKVSGVNASVLIQERVRLAITFLPMSAEAYNNENVKMVVKDGNTVVQTIDVDKTVVNAGAGIYRGSATFDNVGSSDMRTVFTITLQDTSTGTDLTSPFYWSIESYVAQTRAGSNQAKTDVCNAMLVYGDAAAAYFS